MTNRNLGGWLLVALAIVGLTFAVPVVSAHGDDTTADDAPTDNATADDWATWMEVQMTEHMGPGSVEWMESHMGVTVDEMAQDMADEEYHDGPDNRYHDRTDGNYNGGMYGQGHC
ncbi:hypothetical protein [Salinibaculum rarum]|uniref:hypothetical protein n=1 Tax=Salinibaculum rarum TaxID=3058903 RepID=UPI00265E3D88|nr:hypothetical protein [Salinibaculum sp. KK48]